MMEIICCEYCGDSTVQFGSVSVDVTLRKHNIVCNCCNNSIEEKQQHFFCSVCCFVEYMKRQTGFGWKERRSPIVALPDKT